VQAAEAQHNMFKGGREGGEIGGREFGDDLFGEIAKHGEVNLMSSALLRAGLEVALTDGSREFTVFCPDDDAFAALARSKGHTKLSFFNDMEVEIAEIAKRHVVEGRYELDDLPAEMTTIGGARIATPKVVRRRQGFEPWIEFADLAASNGVFHIIDEVVEALDEEDGAAASGTSNTDADDGAAAAAAAVSDGDDAPSVFADVVVEPDFGTSSSRSESEDASSPKSEHEDEAAAAAAAEPAARPAQRVEFFEPTAVIEPDADEVSLMAQLEESTAAAAAAASALSSLASARHQAEAQDEEAAASAAELEDARKQIQALSNAKAELLQNQGKLVEERDRLMRVCAELSQKNEAQARWIQRVKSVIR